MLPKKQPKKVFIFLYTLTGGGAEKVLGLISKYIDKENFSITFVVYDDTNIDYAYTGNIESLNIQHSSSFIIRQLFHILAAWRLMKLVVAKQPDLILTTSPHLNNMVATIKRILYLIGTKFNHIIRIANYSDLQKGRLHKAALAGADYIIFTTSQQHQQVQHEKLSIKNYSVVPNPVEVPNLQKIVEKKYDLVAVGRLVPAKGFDILIKAMKIIVKKLPEVKLIILGGGEQQSELVKQVTKNKLTKNIALPGRVPHEQVFKTFQQAKTFVLSSRHEGFPNVLVEAMAHGLPVIATNCPTGPDEILQQGKYGILVPVDNEERLAKEIIKVLQDNELRDKLSRLSLEGVQRFNIKNIVKEYENIFIKS